MEWHTIELQTLENVCEFLKKLPDKQAFGAKVLHYRRGIQPHVFTVIYPVDIR